MKKLLHFGWLIVSMAAGCGANDSLRTRVSLLERELGDARNANRRLESRLDEVQIQLELLRRTGGRPAPAHIPKLPVVKVAPPTPGAPGGGPKTIDPDPASASSSSVDLGPAVDPADVTERIPVDRRAAKRPLEDSDSIASQSLEVREDSTKVLNRRAAAVFEEAFSLYRKNEFREAAAALVSFADRHPEHSLASEALFYAGKAELILGKLGEAEREFLKVARAYPKQERSAEALLMAGTCQEKQGRIDEARGTYLQLVDAYPLSEHARMANSRLAAIR